MSYPITPQAAARTPIKHASASVADCAIVLASPWATRPHVAAWCAHTCSSGSDTPWGNAGNCRAAVPCVWPCAPPDCAAAWNSSRSTCTAGSWSACARTWCARAVLCASCTSWSSAGRRCRCCRAWTDAVAGCARSSAIPCIRDIASQAQQRPDAPADDARMKVWTWISCHKYRRHADADPRVWTECAAAVDAHWQSCKRDREKDKMGTRFRVSWQTTNLNTFLNL